MRFQKDRQGYLLIDHRASPGINEAERDKLLKLGHFVPLVPEGTKLELGTRSCAHCGTVVVMNPDRTRSRGHCFKCDRYLCDPCAAIGNCRPVQALADAVVGSDKPVDPLSPLIFRS